MRHFMRHCGESLLGLLLSITMLIMFVIVIAGVAPVLSTDGKTFGALIALYLLGTVVHQVHVFEFDLSYYRQMRADADFEARFRARFFEETPEYTDSDYTF